MQFDFPAAPPPQQPPEWWLAFLKFLARLQPFFEILFWGGLGVLALIVLFFIAREIIRLRNKERDTGDGQKNILPDWRPPIARAQALLADADRLAAQGRFAEAVHLILFRSIDDIDERRPRSIKPALTSRNIAELEALPKSARPAFAQIATSVERSFFGGREIDEKDFAECRRAYEAFALPHAWSA
ncbi:MAG TPA: DUF4129 domain-containing protein [Micropepsaceae bacterium]|nr:DUF4129 domain-containing protein [Micropepsaceae bacterium]